MSHCPLNLVEMAAVGEGIRRHVEDPHDVGTVEGEAAPLAAELHLHFHLYQKRGMRIKKNPGQARGLVMATYLAGTSLALSMSFSCALLPSALA
ncbi:hypothetical protein D3C85_1481950 [compost metagenome]